MNMKLTTQVVLEKLIASVEASDATPYEKAMVLINEGNQMPEMQPTLIEKAFGYAEEVELLAERTALLRTIAQQVARFEQAQRERAERAADPAKNHRVKTKTSK